MTEPTRMEPLLLQPEDLVDAERAAFGAALEREFHFADMGVAVDCMEGGAEPALTED